MMQEVVSLWDSDEKEILGTVPKGSVYDDGVAGNFSVVHGLLFNERTEVLLQKLSRSKRQPGKWGSSFAGFVLNDEYPAIAAERKMFQELHVDRIKLTGHGYSDMDISNGRRKRVHVFVGRYNGPSDPNTLSFDREQIDELRFVPFGEIYPVRSDRKAAYTDTLPVAVETFARSLLGRMESRNQRMVF